MVESSSPFNNNGKNESEHYDKLASLGLKSLEIIHKLHNPIDAVNRFLNLALQNTDEDSQNRQFLLDSKTGIREMSVLLRKLSAYTEQMEEEWQKVRTEDHE